MTPSARLSAAIEVLSDILTRRRPAADALKDWGLARRFAGSTDRAAVASLVYDALRRRASAAWTMGFSRIEEATPRAILLGALHLARGLKAPAIEALCDGSRFAPQPLSDEERARLADAARSLADAPAHVAGDFPEWLAPSLARAFGAALVAEMQAMAQRAPLDLRVNTLKGQRCEALSLLAHLRPSQTPLSPIGIRLLHGEDGRGPSVRSEPAFLDGLIEIQDEGSQLVSLLCDAKAGESVIDLCAGAGGKTLTLAAMMADEGRIVATDGDRRRLVPIHARLARSGTTIVEVRTPRDRAEEPLAGLEAEADLCLVDAPCTGVGAWRRNPDAKWRIRPGSLKARIEEQDRVLDRAARFTKRGGRLAYITCSLLPEENEERVQSFLHRHEGWRPVPSERTVMALPQFAAFAGDRLGCPLGLLLTPHRTKTDGFFLAVLHKFA
jgi:16S rRNA (cytosine967-C5)-methyltransferase